MAGHVSMVGRLRDKYKKSWDPRLQWIESDLIKMIKICNEKNVTAILQDYPTERIGVNNIIRRVAEKTSCILVENESVFSALLKNGLRQDELFILDTHCTARGYTFMAINVFNAIVKAQIFSEISQTISLDIR